jgi:porphyrinogen peroxidase
MDNFQQGILADVPQAGRHMFFSMAPGANPARALQTLTAIVDGEETVVGIGESLALALGQDIEPLRVFPAISAEGFDIPSTPAALWCWLRGTDPGEILHRGRNIEQALAPHLSLNRCIDVFKYDSGRDLTGFEDGTENPVGEEAVATAIVHGTKTGLDGSSFVAVQQWLHDLDRFSAMAATQQDNSIGRQRESNEELEDAPASAHVKRTAQEDFEPAAFVLRRSMPWIEGRQAGLVFVAFGKSFDAFEALLHRMVGADDGIADALFSFTRPVSGSYFWCPPMAEDRLDLQLLGL